MHPRDSLALRVGEIVVLSWPGSETGPGTKRALVQRVTCAGTKVGVLLERVRGRKGITIDPGRWRKTVQYFGAGRILGRVGDLGE